LATTLPFSKRKSVQAAQPDREPPPVAITGAKITGISRNTIKDHVTALTEKGQLNRHGAGRGTWYALL
jgi:hypothetical protein